MTIGTSALGQTTACHLLHLAIVPGLLSNDPSRGEPGAQPIISGPTADQPLSDKATRRIREDAAKDKAAQRLRHRGGVVQAGDLISDLAPKCGQSGRPADTRE